MHLHLVFSTFGEHFLSRAKIEALVLRLSSLVGCLWNDTCLALKAVCGQ